MPTVAEALADAAARLTDGVRELVGPDRYLRDINDKRSNVIFFGPSRYFAPLSLEGKRTRSRLLEAQRHFFAVAHALLRFQPDATRRFDEWEKTVRDVIDHEKGVHHSTTAEAARAVAKAIGEILAAVDQLHDPAEGATILVPDTNALLAGPALPQWTFADMGSFELVLVPQVLSELDNLKVGHRRAAVSEKARSVIREIKTAQAQGALTEGVYLREPEVRLRSVAVEPDMGQSLPWLDAGVPDDRIIASTIEAMRCHPRSTVVIVTGDINLQNKASFARVPYREPPTSDEPGA